MEPRITRMLHEKGRRLGIPVSATFELTPRCNFNCKMCYVHLAREEQERQGKELTAGQWLEIAKKAKEAGTVFLLLTGGEPFLRPDFPELYSKLREMGFYISINSNGSLLDGELAELLKRQPPHRINVTLYGISNDSYQNLCGVPAYDTVIRNVKALRAAGIYVRINMSVTPDNRGDMKAVYAAGNDLGAQVQAASYMFPPLRAHPELIGQNYRLSPEDSGALLAEFNRLRMSEEDFYRMAEQYAAGQAAEERLDGEEDCERDAHGPMCRAGSTSFWLNWDGRMTPCGQLTEPGADVLALGFDEAWRRVRQATAQILLPKECAGCRYETICHPCAAKCFCETGCFDRKPEYVCQMTHAYAAIMAKAWKDRVEDSYGTET